MQSEKTLIAIVRLWFLSSHLSLRNSFELLYVGLQIYYSRLCRSSQRDYELFALLLGKG